MAQIHIHFDSANEKLEDVIKAIQLPPQMFPLIKWIPLPPDDRDERWIAEQKTRAEAVGGVDQVKVTGAVGRTTTNEEMSQEVLKTHTTEPALTPMDGDRERGKAGPGHRRRTDKQIAEDEVFFAQVRARGHAAIEKMDKGVEQQTTSTQDPRNDLANEPLVDNSDAQTAELEAAQDAVDEAAESAANRGANRGAEPALDDLRRVIGEYQKKFGMEQAARRVKEMLGVPLFEVPSKDIGAMVHKVAAALEHDKKEDAKFAPVQTKSGVVQAAEPSSPKTATKEEVNAAFNDYAQKFDGSLDPNLMLKTREDVPRIFERLFGVGKRSFKDVEKTPENLGRILAAVRAEIDKNTFGRTPK